MLRRIARRARREVELLVARSRFRRLGVPVGHGLWVAGLPIVEVFPGSSISIGANARMISVTGINALGVSRPVTLRTREPGAVIEIGDDVGMSGAAIVAACSVVVGDRVLLGADAVLLDTDGHEREPTGRRYAGKPAPRPEHRIVVEDDVFIGTRAMVMKGVRIGAGSIVAAGSIVTRDVPPLTIVAGSPARVVGPVRPEEPE